MYIMFFFLALLGSGRALTCLALSIIGSVLYLIVDQAVFTGVAMFFLGGFVYYFTAWITNSRPRLALAVHAVTIAMWVGVVIHFYVFDFFQLSALAKAHERMLTITAQNYLLFPVTICSLALLGIRRDGMMKSISWIGDITYSSYLIHFPLQLLAGLAVSYGILNREFYKSPISLIGFFVILIPLSLLIYRKFELPIQRKIRRKFSGKVRSEK